MKLLFKQRLFSWLDSYDIYDENENTMFQVKSKLSWGHLLKIMDQTGAEVGTVKQEIFTLLPRFQIYKGDMCLGCIKKELTFFKPKYDIEYNGWHVEGNIWGWDYTITNSAGMEVARISKELFHMTDTYVIDVNDNEDPLIVLMFVLAIDAEKCSSQNN